MSRADRRLARRERAPPALCCGKRCAGRHWPPPAPQGHKGSAASPALPVRSWGDRALCASARLPARTGAHVLALSFKGPNQNLARQGAKPHRRRRGDELVPGRRWHQTPWPAHLCSGQRPARRGRTAVRGAVAGRPHPAAPQSLDVSVLTSPQGPGGADCCLLRARGFAEGVGTNKPLPATAPVPAGGRARVSCSPAGGRAGAQVPSRMARHIESRRRMPQRARGTAWRREEAGSLDFLKPFCHSVPVTRCPGAKSVSSDTV